MKKHVLIILSFILASGVYCQSGGAFKINLQYTQSTRPELKSYLEDLSDSMQLTEVLDIDGGFGFGFGILSRGDHTEFEAGGSYTRSADEIGTEKTNLIYYNHSDIAIYFGMNYLPVNFFLAGGSFVINSATAKSNESGPGPGDTYLELLPATNFHVFRGYSVALKAQSGFYINLNKEKSNRMRLTGYYIYGLSKYNFYTVSENDSQVLKEIRKQNIPQQVLSWLL